MSGSVVLELSWGLRIAACMESSRVDCRSRTSMSYVSDSVVLELSWSLRMAACMGSHGWIAEVGLRDFLRV